MIEPIEPYPRPMDETTGDLYRKIVELCTSEEFSGLDDYGIMDALANAIVRLAR